MKITTEENIVVKETRVNIEDALKSSKNVSLKIEAAHAGVMNGNFLFYLPKALQHGANSLNNFYKPLQKKHYSKTIGYIYNSDYVATNTDSRYYKEITSWTTPKELTSSVKKYMKSKEYEQNSKQGFGVLISKAKLHDLNKIEKLQYNDSGTVSVAGDAGLAYCSICSNNIAECGHKLGMRYKNNELCFAVIADDFEVDHISFETIPANWETKSLIIQDSQNVGHIELIEEGHLMKLSLAQLKEKLGNIETVLTELDLIQYLERYNQEAAKALNSQYVLTEEKLLAFNTPLTIYVANKVLETLEDSEDKELIVKELAEAFEATFKDKTEEEVKAILDTVIEEVPVVDPIVDPAPEPAVDPVVEPTPEDKGTDNKLEVTDANQLALAIADSLSLTVESTLHNFLGQLKELFQKEQEVKANKILEDRVSAYKADLENSGNITNMVTKELKESLINQIILVKGLQDKEDYIEKLKKRSVQELKMTLEDHLELTNVLNKNTIVPTVEPLTKETPVVTTEDKTLQVQDNLQTVTKTDVTEALDTMVEDQPVLEIEDADKTVNEILSKVEGKLSQSEFTKLYKKAVFDHGSKTAKKLHIALKAQNKI